MSNEPSSDLDDVNDKYSNFNTKRKGKKTYKCEDCGKPFNSAKQLQKHYETCEEY
jgi:hypothetical protein